MFLGACIKVKQFCEILSEALEQKHLSQTKLAKHIGCNPRVISSYATGKTEPDFNTILLICAYLNIDLNAVAIGNNQKLTILEHKLLKVIRDQRLTETCISDLVRFLEGFGGH